MKLLNKILTGIVCGTLVFNGAMAANDCSNPAYKQSHPERCKYASQSTNTSTYLMLGAGVAAAGAALAALAGGGSSGGDGATYDMGAQYNTRSVIPTPITRTSVGEIDMGKLESAISSETYDRNAKQYDEIQLAYSIARDFIGRGSNIAVLDTSFKTSISHGTVVKTTIEGVAPGAEIVPYTISFDGNNVNTIYSEIGNKIAEINDANIYNNSWNATITADTIHTRGQFVNLTSQNFVNAISNAATQNDAIFVWAAGNDSYTDTNGVQHWSESGMLSALPRVAPELNGHFVNVVAWDSDASQLATYSNICGVTKDYCITAPGTIYTPNSVNPNKNYAHHGTSFAAPVVSAAIAVIREAWDYLDSSTVVQILFDTATDLGDAGVDEIYGHGMLDLEAATRPVGTPTIAISDTVSQPLQIARVSAQIANGIKSANPTMAFFDKYGREFETNVADNIEIQNRGLGFERMRGDDARMKVSMGDMEFGFYRSDMLSGTGFLQTNGDTTMTYIATNKSHNFGKFELFGRTQLAVARPRGAEESIISEFSNIYTASAYVGLRGDEWSFSVGVPDTIVDGTMNLHLASGRNTSGAITYRDYAIDMATTPAIEYMANYKFLTAGFVDNPYGNNEFYVFAKTKFAF